MRKSYQYYAILLAAVLFAVQSCKKVDGIDNNSVIDTPYTLYFTDSSGSLYNSNNGDTVKTRVFGVDGVPARAICIAGHNLIWVKSTAQLSVNNGVNFNATYARVYPATYDNSLLLYAQNEKRIYMVSNDPLAPLGLVYNALKNDSLTTWVPVPRIEYDTVNITTNANFSSITQLSGGMLVAYDVPNARCYSKAPGSIWKRMQNNNLPIVPFNVSHWGNVLLAYDWNQGANGIYYSNDYGDNWNQYSGVPGTRILSVCAPFDQTLLIGTDGIGVYKYNSITKTFEASNNGLDKNTRVSGITYKENIYKNGNTIQYVYITTNNGVYRSSDLGANWSRVVKGNFVGCR